MGHDETRAESGPLRLHTTDGIDLQAELALPDTGPRAAAVICHPHPLHGGSMHTPVGDALFRALPDIGVAALRFNFRGVEGSSGSHDDGRGEQLDVVAAVDSLLAAVGAEVPLVVAGWSFGADVSLAVTDERIAGWVAIAPPLRVLDIEAFGAGTDQRPKRLLVPEHDQFNPPASAADRTADWANTSIEVVAQADHFLAGKLNELVGHTADFINTLT